MKNPNTAVQISYAKCQNPQIPLKGVYSTCSTCTSWGEFFLQAVEITQSHHFTCDYLHAHGLQGHSAFYTSFPVALSFVCVFLRLPALTFWCFHKMSTTELQVTFSVTFYNDDPTLC